MSLRASYRAGIGGVACALLAGCVDPNPILSGEPDPLVARRMLSSVGAVNDKNKAVEVTSCEVTPPPPNPAIVGTCYWTLKSLIDYRYEHYKTNLLHAADDGNLTGDLLALGLTTAGSITPGAAGARLFSALASGVLGIKTLVNQDVLFKQTITLITGEMDSDRAAVDARNSQHLAVPSYTTPMVVNDMLAYYEAGTFQHAMTSLQGKVSQPAAAATPIMAKTVITFKDTEAGTYPTGEVFDVGAMIGSVLVNASYTTTAGQDAQAVATALAKLPEFASKGVTASQTGKVLTLTYSTVGVVAWSATGYGATYMAIAPQATVPAAAGTASSGS